MAVASSRLPEFVLFRCRIVGKRCKKTSFFTPFCSLLGYGMITYTSDNPLIRVIPNQ